MYDKLKTMNQIKKIPNVSYSVIIKKINKKYIKYVTNDFIKKYGLSKKEYKQAILNMCLDKLLYYEI